MQTTSELYKAIVEGPHDYEWKVVINDDATYDQTRIVLEKDSSVAPRVIRQTFPGGEPSVGNCLSSEFSCVLIESTYNIPSRATVKPYFRAVNTLGDESEWILAGVFFIDTRRADEESGTVALTCYDAMLKAEGLNGNSYYDLASIRTWPAYQTAVVADIARIMGVSVDERTNIQSSFTAEDPEDKSMREVLGIIAAEHCGNWIISPSGKLRLVELSGSNDEIDIASSFSSLEVLPPFPQWGRVVLSKDRNTVFIAGENVGIPLNVESPWATQAKAEYMFSVIRYKRYIPFSASEAFLDPAAELGDKVKFISEGYATRSNLWSIDFTCDRFSVADIGATGGEETNHEYPYIPATRRRYRKIEEDVDELEEEVEEQLEDVEEQIVNLDERKVDLADASEILIDQLSTSRRIRKYILSDTSDDNYLLIQNNYLRMITGTVTGGSQTVQATNLNGRLLYWQKEPVGHNADGYPTDDHGNQIYATTKPTNWPVMTYVYTETVKGSVALQNSSGVYVPEITLGAGDGNGNSRGFVWKDTDNLNIQLMNSEGDPVSIVLGDDGYVDVDKFRRATEMNFSGWSGGFFTEELDGAISVNYFVEFDNQERPIRIYDQTHSCDIVW